VLLPSVDILCGFEETPSPPTDTLTPSRRLSFFSFPLLSPHQIWDLRNYRCLHSFKTDHPPTSIDISDRNLLAMSLGRQVQVLQDPFTRPVQSTYLTHNITCTGKRIAGEGAVASKRALASSISIENVSFRPYEDVLAIGHSHGITAIIVPGAGEPNFDSFESNPFITPKQRNEGEIQSLLSKLSHDMIGLGD
jgi:U3 small nucleolar RNA-associated protein 7